MAGQVTGHALDLARGPGDHHLLRTNEVADFESEVLAESFQRPVLVDFWATWCGPCHMLSPVLEKLAEESAGAWKLAKVDTDRNPAISAQYDIQGIPAVKLFLNGAVQSEFVGALPEEAVSKWLAESLPSEAKLSLEAARALLESGDEGQAEAVLCEALAREPESAEARLLLAKLLIHREPGEAAELARGAKDPEGALHQLREAILAISDLMALDPKELPEGGGRAAFALALASLSEGELDGTLSQFIEVIRLDRPYHGDAARLTCVAIFTLLGPQHATTRKHRRAFDMALF